MCTITTHLCMMSFCNFPSISALSHIPSAWLITVTVYAIVSRVVCNCWNTFRSHKRKEDQATSVFSKSIIEFLLFASLCLQGELFVFEWTCEPSKTSHILSFQSKKIWGCFGFLKSEVGVVNWTASIVWSLFSLNQMNIARFSRKLLGRDV